MGLGLSGYQPFKLLSPSFPWQALNDERDAHSCLTTEVTSKMAVLWEEVEEKVDKDIGQLRAFVEVCVCGCMVSVCAYERVSH